MKYSTLFGALAATCLLATAPAFGQCETTIYASNNQFGTAGATIFFNLTAGAPVGINGFELNSTGLVGDSIGIEVWTTPGTYAGNEMNQAVWTMVAMDDGLATAMGVDFPSPVSLASAFMLPAGTTGIALVSVGSGYRYTNGTGTNEQYIGTNLTLDAGSVTSIPFGGNLFQPRVFNGAVCVGSGGGVGTPFCNPNENNSTGMPTTMSGAFGSGVGSDLHLDVSQGPPNQFGYFLVGTASSEPGVMLPNSSGRLCLALGGGNSVGRYNVTGTQFNSLSQFDAAGMLQNIVGTSGSSSGYDIPTSVPISGSPQIMSGQTWHFQLWHREAGGDSNFSNGLSVAF